MLPGSQLRASTYLSENESCVEEKPHLDVLERLFFQKRQRCWHAMCKEGYSPARLASSDRHQGEVITARGDLMKEKELRPREQQVVELLLQGCDNDEISKQLKMARRTVKAHFNRLFSRFGINGGVKRVKLATLLYRRQLWSTEKTAEPTPTNGSSESSHS
jgi:DNA-binding NarL/FixJ family response regulator